MLCFEDLKQFRSVQQCLSTLCVTQGLIYRLWLQNLVCFVNDFHSWSERFLRFFFQVSLPESQLMCLNCPGGCGCCLPVLNSAVISEVVSGVSMSRAVCKNIFVCKRCFKIFQTTSKTAMVFLNPLN